MAVITSAPGNVLMTGGYLIFDRPNAGIVLSTNARFYAIVKPLYDELQTDSWAWAWTDVKLTSPQMSRETLYKLSLKHLMLHCISSSDLRNPFVEYAVQYAVAAAYATLDNDNRGNFHKKLLQGLDITILGHNDFYSYRNQIEESGLPLSPESLGRLPSFASIPMNSSTSNRENCKPEVAKTGLGSSAAMTTAVVAALLYYLGVVKLSSSTMKNSDADIVHVVAQTAHCIAQGKDGSGFDISSAVYGSQRYVRFSPTLLSPAQGTGEGKPFDEVISNVLEANWDQERTKFTLPPLMTLLLGEAGTGGLSTPSMERAVSKWQKSDPQKSSDILKKLSEANAVLENHFNLLSKLAEGHWELYKCVIQSCSISTPDKWTEKVGKGKQLEIVQTLLGARNAMLQIRFHMQLMGQAAGIPVEPESQTQLLDLTMKMEGILLAGVPGVGGFDGIFVVTLGDSATNLIKIWTSNNVLALHVREDPRGVVLENIDPRSTQITSSISSLQIK